MRCDWRWDAIEDKMPMQEDRCDWRQDAIENNMELQEDDRCDWRRKDKKKTRCSCINKQRWLWMKQRCALKIKDAFEVKHERIKRWALKRERE